jgi:hypothetical protein
LFIGEIFYVPQSTIVKSGYPFQSFGRKAQKGFPLPSLTRKEKAIKSMIFTMKSVKNEKAIIPTKNRTDFELAKLTVTPIHFVF